jgi:transposase
MKQHPDLRFIQDNAPVYSARLTQEQLAMRGITPLRWPPGSPDLNPIEAVWQRIKQRLRACPDPPQTVSDLRAAVMEE